jgi:predicted DNA-binding transcriptional regulator AlpA
MKRPPRRPELEEVLRRFLALPTHEQIDLFLLVSKSLRFDAPAFDDELVKRQESLESIRRAAAQLGLERPPTVAEYESAARELRLSWSWQQIHRLWSSFATAAQVALGDTAPTSAQQRSFMSRYGALRLNQREPPLDAVRRWLATEPLPETAAAYDAFAREHNYTLARGEIPLPRYQTMIGNLALPWRDIVAVARGDLERGQAIARRKEKRDHTQGPHDLIAVGTIALIVGAGNEIAHRLTRQPDFPRPALILAGRRAWLRDEVADYLRGERPPLLKANRLRNEYMTAGEVAERLAIHLVTLSRMTEPRAIGQVAGCNYWLVGEVEAYACRHAADLARRRSARRRPGAVNPHARKTAFVTKVGLMRELGANRPYVDGLVREAGFPRPVARFDDAAVWLREDVAAFLTGHEVSERREDELQEELIDSIALADYLGYTTRSFYNASEDLPAPVASVGGVNVRLKREVDAWLAAEPERLEQRERRLFRRRA